MLWDAAEAALRTHIESGWAAGAYSTVPLVFENDNDTESATFVAINIEGTFAEKSIYGSTGKRMSIEGGIVFFHAFVPRGSGKATALGMTAALAGILELQVVGSVISLDGANPPSPVDSADGLAPNQQPRGTYYRCSGSVPFIVIGTR